MSDSKRYRLRHPITAERAGQSGIEPYEFQKLFCEVVDDDLHQQIKDAILEPSVKLDTELINHYFHQGYLYEEAVQMASGEQLHSILSAVVALLKETGEQP